MSMIQRLMGRFAPSSWFASMEAESRRWIVGCRCGHEQSLWDIGGIRWNKTGSSRMWWRCPQCGQSSWHTLTYREK